MEAWQSRERRFEDEGGRWRPGNHVRGGSRVREADGGLAIT